MQADPFRKFLIGETVKDWVVLKAVVSNNG
jgi:hypothetical protein